MKFSVFFIIVFVIGVIFSDIVKDWWTFFYGVVFSISVYNICEHLIKMQPRRQLR